MIYDFQSTRNEKKISCQNRVNIIFGEQSMFFFVELEHSFWLDVRCVCLMWFIRISTSRMHSWRLNRPYFGIGCFVHISGTWNSSDILELSEYSQTIKDEQKQKYELLLFFVGMETYMVISSTWSITPIGWRPQIVLLYLFKYSVNAGGLNVSMMAIPWKQHKNYYVFQLN